MNQTQLQSQKFDRALEAVIEKACLSIAWDYAEAWIPNSSGTRIECSFIMRATDFIQSSEIEQIIIYSRDISEVKPELSLINNEHYFADIITQTNREEIVKFDVNYNSIDC